MPVAKKCVPVQSSWVSAFILTCEGELAVLFRNGVCCLYPGTSEALFELALTWEAPGKFIHAWLYNKRPYLLIKNPCPPGECTVAVPCCLEGVPTTLHASLAAGSDTCGCVEGTTATLTYNAAAGQWQGSAVLCGQAVNLDFACAFAPSWALDVTGPSGSTGISNVPLSCSPFLWTDTITWTGTGVCSGQSEVTITE